jgi:tetratricopeptide (TPR) repeat protein
MGFLADSPGRRWNLIAIFNHNAMLTPPFNRLFYLPLLIFLADGCAPRSAREGEPPLNRAIMLYVAGDYKEARGRFTELTGRLKSDDDLETAYLYLARCCEALGEYPAAVDALTAGAVIRGDPVFREYLYTFRDKIEADPAFLAKQQELSRAHLACLIDVLFLSAPAESSSRIAPPRLSGTFFLPADVKTHWAEDRIRRVILTGAMETLPDSLFHTEAMVTRSAFYFTVQRMERLFLKTNTPGSTLFPAGYKAIFREQLAARDDPRLKTFVTGREAVDTLETLRWEMMGAHD